jgi:uncharacterized protein (TIGR03000 family)
MLVLADTAHAQRRGGGGGGGNGRGNSGWNNGGRYNGSGYGGYNNNYYNNNNNDWYRYVAPFVGGYLGGYGNNSYRSPYYSGYQNSYPSTSYYYAPSQSYSNVEPNTPPNNAEIRVIVPDSQARVWFDGNPTQQTGTERWFYTPTLQAGATNSYRVRAAWMQNGREMIQERVVNVNPGQSVTVEFNQGVAQSSPQDPLPTPAPVTNPAPIVTNPAPAVVIEGRVLRTGPDHFVIQNRDNQQITVYTNPQTRFMLNQNPGAFTDVRVGSNVNFGYMMQGDRRIANTVTIRP